MREVVRTADSVLIAGDVIEVVTVLIAAANRRGVTVMTDPVGEKAELAVIVVQVEKGQSALARGLKHLEAFENALTRDAIRVVVTVAGVTKIAPATTTRLLGPQIQHQIDAAGRPNSLNTPFGVRIGTALLLAAGVRVLRVSAAGA